MLLITKNMGLKKHINFGKGLIFIIGLIFTIYGVFLGVLVLYGTETTAKITNYRRQLGERPETIPNQYTYLFAYEFIVDGKTYSGNGQKIGSPVFLKNNGNSFITIRFLPAIPQLNAAYDNKKTYLNVGVSLIIGIGLLFITRKME